MIMKKMALTPEQEAELPLFRQKYLNIACSGQRADRAELQSAINDAYALIDKPAPTLLIMSSPAAAMLTLTALSHFISHTVTSFSDQSWEQFWDQRWDQLGQIRSRLSDQLGEQFKTQLWDQFREHLSYQLKTQLWDQFRSQVPDELKGQLWGQFKKHLTGQLSRQFNGQFKGQLWDRLDSQCREQLGDEIVNQLHQQLRGHFRDQLINNSQYFWESQDLYAIAWARFAQQIGAKLDPETDRHLDILERIARQCEWWWPYDGLCIASERPLLVKLDERHRLHCDHGPAITYADGYDFWGWHGVSVPKKWIMDKAIKAEEAIRWQKAEQHRAAMEILGWDMIMAKLNARTINKHDDPEIGELIEADIPDVGPERFLCVRQASGRTAIPVPSDTKTVIEAQPWLYQYFDDEIRQLKIWPDIVI
jgi:hypothetical protein